MGRVSGVGGWRQSTKPSPLVSTRRRLHPSRPPIPVHGPGERVRGTGAAPAADRSGPRAFSRGTEMRSKYVSGFLLAFGAAVPLRAQTPRAAPPVSAPVANLRYEVGLDSASAALRTLKVAVTFDVGGTGPVML